MAATRYVVGLFLASIAIVPLVLGAARLRRRFLPDLVGSAGAVAVIVMALSAVVATAEALGTVGEFRRVAMCVTLAIVGLVACWLGRERTAEAPKATPRQEYPRVMNIVASIAVALVAAAWVVRTVASLRHGMETIDTLWYHMPTAARFVQQGSTTALHYLDSDPVTVFYPATSPLLHAYALQLFSNDFLSPLLNLGWLAFALLASWSIGSLYKVAPVTMIGGAIVVATPGYVATQPGGAYTDIVGLALFLASVALVLHGRRAPRARLTATAIAALAAGLALGTKFTFLAPVGALTLAVLLDAALDRRDRRTWLRAAVAWCVPLFLIGGYFYVRNAVRVGNPLPSTSFGPLHLPAPPVPTPTFTVGQYLFDGAVWRDFYLPGLWQSLGPVWWAIFTVAIAAGVLALIFGRDALQRLLGLVVLVTIVAYVLTPQFLGFVDRPAYFVFNVRYVSPALVLGLCLLPTLPPLARPRMMRWVFAAYVVVLGATQYGPTIWAWSATAMSRSPFLERIATSDIVIGIVVGLLVAVAGIAWAGQLDLGRRSASIAAASIVAVMLVVLGYPLQESYLRHRYQSTTPLPTIYRWAQHHDHERIALIGLDMQYPLYGLDASNYVQYIGRRGKNGAFSPFTTCSAWRRAIDAGRFDYVVVVPRGFYLVPHPTEPPELAWTRGDGRSEIVRRDGPPGAAAVLLRLRGRLDPKTCPQR